MSPDTRQHRGAHPADKQLFSDRYLPELRDSTADLSWLLSRGYSLKSSAKLVGDRHNLKERQRLLLRLGCPSALTLTMKMLLLSCFGISILILALKWIKLSMNF